MPDDTLAAPDYMSFLLDLCEPARHTRKTVEPRDLLRADYNPPHLQLRGAKEYRSVEKTVKTKPHHVNRLHLTYKAKAPAPL